MKTGYSIGYWGTGAIYGALVHPIVHKWAIPLHGPWLAAGKWGKVFHFINQLQFSIVRRTALSYDLLDTLRRYVLLLFYNSASGLLQVFATLLPCCLSLRLFYCDLFVPIFCSEIFLLLSHPVIGKSLPILPLLFGRIFFCLFWKVRFCLYCLVLSRYLSSLSSFVSIFWLVSSLLHFSFKLLCFFYFVRI